MTKSTTKQNELLEVEVFHPLVEEWLVQSGYSVRHHVKLEDGVVDFIATSSSEVLTVEAKYCHSSSEAKSGRFFAQTLDYARQVPGAKPYAALPSFLVTDKTREICNHYGIGLIIIQMDEPAIEENIEIGGHELGHVSFNSVVMMGNLFSGLDYVIKDIVEHHEARETSPVFDFLLILAMVFRSHPDIYGDALVHRQMGVIGHALFDHAMPCLTESDIDLLVESALYTYILPKT